MKVQSLFEQKNIIYSFEIFPPRKETPIEAIYDKLEALSALNPDFISVTYGAGGNTSDNRTRDLSAAIKNKYNTEAVAHLTGINSSKDEVRTVLSSLKEAGIENILALRGDRNPDIAPKKDFPYAKDLISFIKEEESDFNLIGACYPESHPECPSPELNITYTKEKVDAGATHLISQLFFDNNDFYDFRAKARSAGVSVPIEAGIMPVVNKKSIERIVTLCGASLPKKFVKIMHRYEDNPEALFDAGIAYATEQIIDLITNYAEGIHLYTMNNPKIAQRITDNVKSILAHANIKKD